MKIAISELKPQETLIDVNSTAGRVVVGGAETETVIYAKSTASGDITFTRSDANVVGFEYETKRGVYSGSFGFGYSLALAFDAK